MELEFEQLVRELSPSLFRLALSYTGSREDAEDAVQEVYLKYLREGRRFNSHSQSVQGSAEKRRPPAEPGPGGGGALRRPGGGPGHPAGGTAGLAGPGPQIPGRGVSLLL